MRELQEPLDGPGLSWRGVWPLPVERRKLQARPARRESGACSQGATGQDRAAGGRLEEQP